MRKENGTMTSTFRPSGRKGQTSMELLAVVVVVMFMFLSAYIGFIKRGDDVNSFARDTELQRVADNVAYFLSTAEHAPGVRFNVSLPSRAEDCSPSYTVQESFVQIECGGNVYTSSHYAPNATNDTAETPFTVSGDVVVRNMDDDVEVVPQ